MLNDFYGDIQEIFNKGNFKDLDRLLKELKSRFKDDLEILMELNLIKSRHNVLIGNYQKALNDLDLVVAEATSLQNDILLFDAYLVRCEALHFLGKYDIFAKDINIIERIIQNIPKKGLNFLRQKAKLEQLRGRYHTTQGEYNNALEHLFYSKEIYEEIGLKLGIASTVNLIAGIYWRRGEIKKSLVLLNSAVNIFRQLGNKKMLSLTLNNLGILNDLVGDYDLAIQNFKLALNISVKTGDIQNQGNCHGNLGNTYSNIGELDLAKKNFLKSLALNKKIKNLHEIAMGLSNLGELASANSYFKDAIEYFKESISVFKTISPGPLYIYPLVGIIIALINFNSKSEALNYRGILENLYQQHGTFKIQYLNEITKAYYFKSYGNEKDIIKAKQIFLDFYENTNVEFDWRIFCALNYSDTILKNLGESNREKLLKEIKNLMLNVLKLAKSALSFRAYAQTHIILAQIEILKKDYILATEYLKKAEFISDEKKLKLLDKIRNYYPNIDYLKKNYKNDKTILNDLKQELKEMILIRN